MPGIAQQIENKKTENERTEPYYVQPEKNKEIADMVWREFEKYRTNRNKIFSNFRERNGLEYWNDSDQRFNNYRIKPEWKDEWQANISDITTHSKLMSIAAQVVVNRLKPEFYSRFSRDIYSQMKSQLYGDLYNYSDSTWRNGDLDDLFLVIETAKRGTSIWFEGWQKTKRYEGIVSQPIPLEDFYPQYINKFRMEDQDRCIWRSIAFKDDADKVFGNKKEYPYYENVRARGSLEPIDLTFFNITGDIQDDMVEILRYFNKEDDEFYITVNGVLINKSGAKLSTYRKDGELGFFKAVYEPLGPEFFYGRSLPDIMSDNQDGIDFLFNAMFDANMISVMKPIFANTANPLPEDYLQPSRIYQVTDATQIWQPDLKGPDAVSFQVLQELKNRQEFASIDRIMSGLAPGNRTAREVERAVEQAKRTMSLFTVLLQDALQMKAKLRMGTLLQYFLGKPLAKPIIMDSVKLFNGKRGTRILEVVSKDKLAPADVFRHSKKLGFEAAISGPNTEIIQMTPEEIKNFEFVVGVRVPSTVEMSSSLKKVFDERFALTAMARPDLFDSKEVARIYAESSNQDPDRVVLKDSEQPQGPQGIEQLLMGKKSPEGTPGGLPTQPKPLKELAFE